MNANSKLILQTPRKRPSSENVNIFSCTECVLLQRMSSLSTKGQTFGGCCRPCSSSPCKRCASAGIFCMLPALSSSMVSVYYIHTSCILTYVSTYMLCVCVHINTYIPPMVSCVVFVVLLKTSTPGEKASLFILPQLSCVEPQRFKIRRAREGV